jgi:hypothetical protein
MSDRVGDHDSDSELPLGNRFFHHTSISSSVNQITFNLSSISHIPLTHLVLFISASNIMKRETRRSRLKLDSALDLRYLKYVSTMKKDI